MQIKPIVQCLGASIAITVLIVLAVCVFPVRWDIKSFGSVLPQFEPPGLNPNTNVLFVSPDNDWENGHYAQYGLDMVTFPEGKFQWMVFKEGYRGGQAWPANWVIDSAGRASRVGSDQLWLAANDATPDLEQFIKLGCVVVRTPEIKSQLVARWPLLVEANILLLRGATRSFVEFPRLRLNIGQCLRIFLLALVLVSAIGFAGNLAGGEHSATRRWLNFGLAFPAVLIIHTILVYLLGNITSRAISTALVLETLGAAGLIGLTCRKQSRKPSAAMPAPTSDVSQKRMLPKFLLVGGVALFVLFSILRLDFDGDMFTQYLPVARYLYLEGRHDPRAMMSRYGVMTQATYPPGFPIVISTLMWASGLKEGAQVQLSNETNLMVFLYRLAITSLHLSFLVAVGALLKSLEGRRDGFTWLLPVVTIPLLLPLFLGEPGAAEVYMVPIVGFSMVALFAGAQFNQSIYIRFGLMCGGFGLFIKKEGVLILLLITVTWYLTARLRQFSLRQTAADVAGLIAGLGAFFLWRFNLGSLASDEYFFYEKPSIAKLFSDLAVLGKIAEKAMKILLANNYWVVLFLMLPLIITYVWFSRRSWPDQLIPLGIILHVVAVTFMFRFSRHPGGPIEHMEVSYERLVATSVLAASLYGAKSLFESRLMHPDKRDV